MGVRRLMTGQVPVSSASRVCELQLLAEMKAQGLEPNKNAYLAALNALGEAGRVQPARELHAEMLAAGVECDEFGYAALINSYKHAEPVRRPPSTARARFPASLQTGQPLRC